VEAAGFPATLASSLENHARLVASRICTDSGVESTWQPLTTEHVSSYRYAGFVHELGDRMQVHPDGKADTACLGHTTEAFATRFENGPGNAAVDSGIWDALGDSLVRSG